MPRGPFRRRSTVNHQWQQVRATVTCTRGHEVARGEWVRVSYAGHQQLFTCDTHMLQCYGIKRPNSSFGLNAEGDVQDVKTRQAGE